MKPYFLTFLLLAGGCVTLPKETVQLSGEIQTMIASARDSHLALLAAYETERRGRIDDYMASTWIPRFIKDFSKTTNLWDETCKIKNTLDAAVQLQGFVMAAAKKIYAKRKELTDALDLAMADLRAAVDIHYALLVESNQVVTRNLRSVRMNDEVRENLLRKNGVDTDKLTPLRDVSAKLDKLFN